MQAVRLARYHTRRSHLVRFCGAYHGWWDDVQPGVGNPARSTRDLHPQGHGRALPCACCGGGATSRACWSTPCRPCTPTPPRRATPLSWTASGGRGFDRQAYTAWLRALREVCTERGIVLDLRRGLRRLPPGARRRAGILRRPRGHGDLRQDAGRRPAGRRVVRRNRDLMRRFREDRPSDICFARGTFNSHPYVMGAMDEFLARLDDAGGAGTVPRPRRDLERPCRGAERRLRAEVLPVQVANLSSIWTVCYTQPSRYNWMLQYYLRAEGLALSWIGTGRLIFSLDYTDADFEAVADRFLTAGRAMRADGWWWSHPRLTTNGDPAAGPGRGGPPRAPPLGSGRGGVRHDRIQELAAQDVQGRPVVEADVVEGSVRIFVSHTRPVWTPLRKKRCTVRKSTAPIPEGQPQGREIGQEPAEVAARLEEAQERGIDQRGPPAQEPTGRGGRSSAGGCSRPSPLLVLVGGLVDLVVALGLEEEVADLPGDHGHHPSHERGGHRVREQQHVRA